MSLVVTLCSTAVTLTATRTITPCVERPPRLPVRGISFLFRSSGLADHCQLQLKARPSASSWSIGARDAHTAISTSRPMPSTRSPPRIGAALTASHGESSTKWMLPSFSFTCHHIHVNLHSQLEPFTKNEQPSEFTAPSIPPPTSLHTVGVFSLASIPPPFPFHSFLTSLV